jgi:hypothetical protein
MTPRQAKREQMRKLVREWRASGEPASRFASRQGMTKDTFRYWRQRFGRDATDRRSGRGTPTVFAPVRLVGEAGGMRPDVVEIHLASGDMLRVGHELPLERLGAILRVLRDRC